MTLRVYRGGRDVHTLTDEPNRIVHAVPDGVGCDNRIEVLAPAECVTGGFIDLAASRNREVVRAQDAADLVADLRVNADRADNGILKL